MINTLIAMAAAMIVGIGIGAAIWRNNAKKFTAIEKDYVGKYNDLKGDVQNYLTKFFS